MTRPDDGRVGVQRLDVGQHSGDLLRLRRVDLVHDDDICHAQVRLSRVVPKLVAGPKRIDDDDEQIRPEEREVVVPAVPDHDVGLLLRLLEDLAVVDTGVHDHPQLDGALVLLALLDRGLGHVDVDLRREPLDAHRLEIPVGHRMPHERDTDAAVEQDLADVAARLALAGTGSDGAHGDHRLRALEHRRLGPSSRKSAPAARTIDALCITVSWATSE